MSYNGSGTYVPPAGQPVATGTVIQSATFNTLVTDMGNTFNNVLPRDGQAPMQGQLKITDGTSSVPGIAFNSEASSGIYRPTPGALALVASGVENLRINSAGRVMIGTTTDDGTNKLQVNGPVKVVGALNVTDTLNVTGAVTAASLNGPLTGNVTGNVTGNLTGNVTGNVSGTAANVTSTVAIANGGTGATSAAAAKLNLALDQVNNTSDANKPVSTAQQTALSLKANLNGAAFTGNVSAPQVTSNGAVVSTTNGITTVLGADINGSYIESQGTNNLRFYTGGAESVRINATGKVGIGTSSPAAELHIESTGNASIRMFDKASNYWTMKATTDFTLTRSSLEYMRWDSSGNVGMYPGCSFGAGNGYAGNTTAAASGTLKLYDPADGWTRLNNNYASGGIYLNTYNGVIVANANGNLGIGAAPKGNAGGFNSMEINSSSLMAQGNSGSMYMGKNWYYNGQYKYKTTGNNAFLYVQDGGGHSWHTAPVGSADTVVPWTQAMALDTSGNLLVNASTPQGKLTVGGTIGTLSPDNTAVGQFLIDNTGLASLTSYKGTGSALRLSTADAAGSVTERLRLTNTGDANFYSTIGPMLSCNSTDANGGYNVLKNNGTVYGYMGAGKALATGGLLNDLTIRTENGTLSFAYGSTEMARFSSGNLLIGTTSSNAKLQIKGVGGSANNGLSVQSPNAVQSLDILPGYQLTNGTATGVQADTVMTIRSSGSTTGILAFATGNNEQARFDASGNLLVGSTSSVWGAAGRGVVEINGSASALVGLKVGGGAAGYLYHDGTNLQMVNNIGAVSLFTGGQNRLNIDTSGSVTVGGSFTAAVVTQSSDENKKENWQAVEPDFLTKLANIEKVGMFDWIETKETSLGVGAQSLETFLPAAVHTDDEGQKTVNYGGAAMVSVVELTKLVLELQARVAELEAA